MPQGPALKRAFSLDLRWLPQANGGDLPRHLHTSLEAALREADPCLPCTSLPPGRMQVQMRVIDAGGAATAPWPVAEP